ncbi:CRISPR-associated endonuclease Cas2 [Tepidimicrobium xylanilyticum]|uniref:CRISPR-associated endoribonuclease Cas2 n=1 Tax=Tepidimicrobium xylanilyticum TaxID=1123352 RepID=A0A1H2XD01_9FIRM|nr:CRISPR-associated endonuclease Cas2 [Tepidimicrobium xylanilyticum]GMG97468.1 CRISPR-associated endonuclease Cas2 [Tepidimicrobium xylanilyticum]SDW90812.1 CRISPR-associated protein, Cas2 family [Tepidimicrobium xylanilyticum]
MFVILVYDVGQKRVAKALKTCRKYLYWVQNSVFEGDITEANLMKLKIELLNVIDTDKDSVVIYKFRSTKYSAIETFGIKKGGEENIL